MSKIGNTIKTALSSIGAKIKNFFTNLRTKIKSWSDNIKNKFKNRTPKNNIVSNSDVQTQKDNSRVQTRDNNVLQPQENMYVYKPTDNSVDNNINVDEQEENQQTDSNEDNQNTTIQTEKIQKIQINEEVGTVEYTTVDGNKYTVDINRVLDNKKAIYKDFSISKKCKDLTGSFIKGRRLEKSLNSLVINGLNNDEDIDKYINCVNSEEKLFFDLEHNTQNSKLGFFDRNNMKKIAEIEQKLGADVQIEPGFFSKIKTQFSELFRKEDTEKENEEKMIAKQYKDAFKMLKNKAINSLYESKEYAKIEGNLEKCANWYMNNGNFKKADKCIETLSGMLKEQNQNYYGPKYKEEANKNNTEYAMENYAQMYWIKGTKIEKLKIKSSLLKGNENEAKRMYSSLLTRLGVSLTTEEFEQSIKNGGLLNGTYSYLKAEQIQNADGTISFNNKFVDVPIIGNEKILQDLEKYKNHKKSGSIITNTVKTEPQINNNEQQQNNNLIKAEEINMEEENSATTQNIANEEDSESIKIATEKRNEILANCKDEAEKERTAKLIRKMLRGRDIKRYSYEWAGLWVIGTFPSLKIDIEQYPALKQYLSQFLPRIEQSGEKGCRKKTSNKWFETQDNIAYYEEFEKEKIVWNRISSDLCFSYDNQKNFILDSMFSITFYSNINLKYLIANLNSSISKFWIKNNAATLGDGIYGAKIYIEKLPIPKINSKNEKIADELINLVDEILKAKEQDKNANTQKLENKINSLVYKLYNLNEEEIKIIEGK